MPLPSAKVCILLDIFKSIRSCTSKTQRARVYLVHVPAERGSVIPEIDSIRDDLPALCEPITAIMGRSMSIWTLNIYEYLDEPIINNFK